MDHPRPLISHASLEVVRDHATGAESGKRVGHGERAPLAHHPWYALAEVCGPRGVEPREQQKVVQVFQLVGGVP